MILTSKLIAAAITLIFIGIVIELVRREKLTFKYASGWLAVLIAALVLAIFDQFLFRISEFLGFELPSNFVFFTLLCIFVFLGLLLTIFLCQQDNRNDITAQKIGLMELELRQLKEQLNNDHESGRNTDGAG